MATKKKRVHETVIREVIERPAKKKTTKKKKSTKKKTARKKSTPKKSSEDKMQKALIENFISLQKVMVNFSNKFDNLSSQISKLLELFEISAKALAEKEFVTDKEKKDNHDVLQKMDEIIDQNKVLARGMTLMHDRISEQEEIPFTQPMPMPQQMQRSLPPPLPRMPPQSKPMPKKPMMQLEEQTPSIRPLPSMSSKPQPASRPLPSQSQSPSNETYQRSISSNNNDSEQNNQH